MKRVVGVLLIAVLSAGAFGQTQLVPATALEHAPLVHMPPGSVRQVTEKCETPDIPTVWTCAYYLPSPLSDAYVAVSESLRASGYELYQERVEHREPNHDLSGVHHIWRKRGSDEVLFTTYLQFENEVLLVVIAQHLSL